jgi:phage portal protein BeeE
MYSLMPYLKRWEQCMSRSLLSAEEKKKLVIQFNVDGLLRGDYKSRMEGYSIGINNGFLSVNDVRRLEGLDLIPAEQGGDTHMVQGAMIPLHMVGAAYSKDAGASASGKERVMKK